MARILAGCAPFLLPARARVGPYRDAGTVRCDRARSGTCGGRGEQWCGGGVVGSGAEFA